MAYEFKKLSDVNVIEAMKDGLNVLVEDGGEIVKLAANSMIPEDVALKSDIPTGVVKSVNGEVPDEAGNVKVSGLPDGSAAYQQLVTDGEGKAKWEDKAFYETIQYGERYGTDNLNCDVTNGGYVAMDAFPLSFDASKQYAVEQYPGYICDVKTSMGINYIGNGSFAGDIEDTGEPFFVMENSGMATVAFKEAPASQLFYLQDVVVTIKPIDEKFLPGAYVRKITLPENVAPSALKAAVNALKNGDAIVMWDFKRIVEGEVSTQDRYAYLRFADTPIAGADEIAGYYSWNWHSDDATLNLFEGVIKYQNSFRLSSSSGDKVYKIAVDDSGTLTTTEV